MIDETKFLDLGTEGAKWFAEVNNKWLDIIGKRVKDIGSMSATDLSRLDQLSWYSTDMAMIRRELAEAAGKTDKELASIFKGLASAGYAEAKKYYDARGVRFVPYSDNMGLLAVVDSIEKNTAGMWKNFSNTTVNQVWSNGNITAGDVYKDVIDEAISDAQLGMTDYRSAIRNTLKKVADEGISYVNYDSGARRRLDSAVRMNILDGMSQIGLGVQNYVGQQFGADGWEISVHTSPAPDHAPIQGHQYTKLKYEALNDSLERRIGTCNCYHFAFAIIVGVSAANYSQKELDQILAENDRKRVFEGKEYTGYEATQKQRQIETEIRRRKDRANLAKASGDDVWRREEQARINALRQKYAEFSDAVGLSVKRDRMSVSGFRNVKAAAGASKNTTVEKFTKITGKHGSVDDLLSVNSKYNDTKEPYYKYHLNCQRCVPAYEMRRRGFDVTAKPMPDPKGDSFYFEKGWYSMYQNPQVHRVQIGDGKAEIEKMMSDWGNGARAEIRIGWADDLRSGHLFVAENYNGMILYGDPQNGSADVSHYFDNADPGQTSFWRIDNLKFNDKIKECVEDK